MIHLRSKGAKRVKGGRVGISGLLKTMHPFPRLKRFYFDAGAVRFRGTYHCSDIENFISGDCHA